MTDAQIAALGGYTVYKCINIVDEIRANELSLTDDDMHLSSALAYCLDELDTNIRSNCMYLQVIAEPEERDAERDCFVRQCAITFQNQTWKCIVSSDIQDLEVLSHTVRYENRG